MNGPEHYREAEWRLGAIEARKLGDSETFAAIEMAQVNATLALAAATWDGSQIAGGFGVGGDVADAWLEATA